MKNIGGIILVALLAGALLWQTNETSNRSLTAFNSSTAYISKIDNLERDLKALAESNNQNVQALSVVGTVVLREHKTTLDQVLSEFRKQAEDAGLGDQPTPENGPVDSPDAVGTVNKTE